MGGPITAFDCLALYAIVRKYSPKLYLEIGSGMTTCFARQAITDARLRTKVVSIDPSRAVKWTTYATRLSAKVWRHAIVSLFDQLEEGDILFLDGSHRSFMNSDVTVFFIDVLPRIKPGVIVHVHDILLPWDYPGFFQDLVLERAIYAGCIYDGLKGNTLSIASHFMDRKISEFSAFFQHPVRRPRLGRGEQILEELAVRCGSKRRHEPKNSIGCEGARELLRRSRKTS